MPITINLNDSDDSGEPSAGMDPETPRQEAARFHARQKEDLDRNVQFLRTSAMREAERAAIPAKHLRIAESNLASEFYVRLAEWIEAFDKELSETDEVGVRLVSFGETVKFHLRGMDYLNPSLIKFIGELEDGSQVELIQHISQISILLMKVPRKSPELPKQRIGFHAIREAEQHDR